MGNEPVSAQATSILGVENTGNTNGMTMEEIIADGKKIVDGTYDYNSEFAHTYLNNVKDFLQTHTDIIYHDFLDEVCDDLWCAGEITDEIGIIVAILEVYYTKHAIIETTDKIATYYYNNYDEVFDESSPYKMYKSICWFDVQMKLHADEYDFCFAYLYLISDIPYLIIHNYHTSYYYNVSETCLEELTRIDDGDYVHGLLDTYMYFGSGYFYESIYPDYERAVSVYQNYDYSTNINGLISENFITVEDFARNYAEKLKTYYTEMNKTVNVPFCDFFISRCDDIANGTYSITDAKAISLVLALDVGDYYGVPLDTWYSKDYLCQAISDIESAKESYQEWINSTTDANWLAYEGLAFVTMFASYLEDSPNKTQLMDALYSAYTTEDAPDFDLISEILHNILEESVTVNIDGFQINTTFGGHRVLYSIDDPTKIVSSEVGMIYGLASETEESDMIVGSSSSSVYSYKATKAGKITGVSEASDSTQTYAMTMKFIDSADYFNAPIRMRAYAKLYDGTYVYSDVYTYSVYDIASTLYDGSLMNNLEAHEYLYDNILKKCNPDYSFVEYK